MTDSQQGQSAPSSSSDNPAVAPYPLPRITIQFCTQCKWMLRAAYFAQELLSTFGTSLGEVALQPSTGGTFIVNIYHSSTTAASETTESKAAAAAPPHVQTTTTLWDRKTDGGFPETKELKRRVRNVIEPGRDLGHVDKDYPKKPDSSSSSSSNDNNNDMTGQNQQPPAAYNPSMAMGGGRGRGMMPLAPPPGHKWEVPQEALDTKRREEEKEKKKKKEECEDCK